MSSQTADEKMSLGSFLHQYRGLYAFKLKVRSQAEVIRILLIRAGFDKNPGHLKRHCCSKNLGKVSKRRQQYAATCADGFISNAVV